MLTTKKSGGVTPGTLGINHAQAYKWQFLLAGEIESPMCCACRYMKAWEMDNRPKRLSKDINCSMYTSFWNWIYYFLKLSQLFKWHNNILMATLVVTQMKLNNVALRGSHFVGVKKFLNFPVFVVNFRYFSSMLKVTSKLFWIKFANIFWRQDHVFEKRACPFSLWKVHCYLKGTSVRCFKFRGLGTTGHICLNLF